MQTTSTPLCTGYTYPLCHGTPWIATHYVWCNTPLLLVKAHRNSDPKILHTGEKKKSCEVSPCATGNEHISADVGSGK